MQAQTQDKREAGQAPDHDLTKHYLACIEALEEANASDDAVAIVNALNGFGSYGREPQNR